MSLDDILDITAPASPPAPTHRHYHNHHYPDHFPRLCVCFCGDLSPVSCMYPSCKGLCIHSARGVCIHSARDVCIHRARDCCSAYNAGAHYVGRHRCFAPGWTPATRSGRVPRTSAANNLGYGSDPRAATVSLEEY